MKKFWFIPMVLLFTGTVEAQMDWKKDPVLVTWEKLIPPGWTIAQKGNQLIIESSKPAFILFENKINAPPNRETPDQTRQRVKTFGKAQKPRLVFELGPRVLVSGKLLSSSYDLSLKETLGINDEFHTVEDEKSSQFVWSLKTKLENSLALVISSSQELESALDRPVAAVVHRAKVISQHRMSYPSGYKFSDYVDIGGQETVMYSKLKLIGNGPWEVVGRAMVLEAVSEPGRKEAGTEVHLVAESVK